MHTIDEAIYQPDGKGFTDNKSQKIEIGRLYALTMMSNNRI